MQVIGSTAYLRHAVLTKVAIVLCNTPYAYQSPVSPGSILKMSKVTLLPCVNNILGSREIE